MPLPLLVVLIALVVLDAALRRVGCYAATSSTWPAGWREVPPRRSERSPYREGAQSEWVLVVKAGIPRAISVFLPPVLGITLIWALASALALGDLADAARGTRPLALVLASLALCLVRVLGCGTTLLAALRGSRRLFFLACGLGLGLDAALARFALPCSDIRADDIRVALAGGAAQAALMLAFAFSVWRRRGLVAPAYPPVPPVPVDTYVDDEDDAATG